MLVNTRGVKRELVDQETFTLNRVKYLVFVASQAAQKSVQQTPLKRVLCCCCFCSLLLHFNQHYLNYIQYRLHCSINSIVVCFFAASPSSIFLSCQKWGIAHHEVSSKGICKQCTKAYRWKHCTFYIINSLGGRTLSIDPHSRK